MNSEQLHVVIEPDGIIACESRNFKGDSCLAAVENLFNAIDDHHRAVFQQHDLISIGRDPGADIYITS